MFSVGQRSGHSLVGSFGSKFIIKLKLIINESMVSFEDLTEGRSFLRSLIAHGKASGPHELLN